MLAAALLLFLIAQCVVAAQNYTLNCTCHQRAGGCMRQAGNCDTDEKICMKLCRCNADGGGYSCEGNESCSGDDVGRVCAAMAPQHRLSRGLACKCLDGAEQPPMGGMM